MTPPLLVLGTSTFAVEVCDLAHQSGFAVAGFVENLDQTRSADTLAGLPIYWIDDAAERFASTCRVVCGLGTTKRDAYTAQARRMGLQFVSVIHPSAQISPTARLGDGLVVGPLAIVGAESSLSDHVLVNRGGMIGHHTTIGAHSSVQPGANIAGACEIGEKVWVGMGAVIIDHTRVGPSTTIGAGAVVTKDLPERVLAVGIPARVIKEGIDQK